MVTAEQQRHGDVVTTNTTSLGPVFQKDARLLEFLAHARTKYPGAQYYGKIDDDVFVCPHSLVSGLLVGTAAVRSARE